jgi:hypothetical protein
MSSREMCFAEKKTSLLNLKIGVLILTFDALLLLRTWPATYVDPSASTLLLLRCCWIVSNHLDHFIHKSVGNWYR